MSQPWTKLGCSEGLYQSLRSMHADYGMCPIGRYRSHKKSAAMRGIAFDMSLAEWWEIWEKSGHYAERGTRRGQYNMARKYDRGGYTVGNVEIVTCYENVIQRMIVHRATRGRFRSMPSHRPIVPEAPFRSLAELVRDNS